MKYAQINNMDIVNGKGVGVALFTQGCPHHCKNCFNPETWSFDEGRYWTDNVEDEVIRLLEPEYISRLSILGGEPLIGRNIEPLTALLKRVKTIYPKKKIWLYTGSKYENISASYYDVIKYCDVIIDGEYIDEQRDLTLKFRGSSNQRIIDVQKSIERKEIVLYEYY